MTAETIVNIPLNQLRESPFNPRKTFNEDELRELARSIHLQGVMQPIVVRELEEEQRHIEHTHEIVFGHRRFRGSRMAGLDDIPCIVRVMTDREAAIAQAHENVKRAGVTPFEEADQFARLMADYGMTADQVADEVDMSRSYVYSRLKLHNAAPAVRQAHTEQGLSTEIAVELARILNHKFQTAGLRAVRHPSGAWMSVRDAKIALKGRFIIDLAAAPFALGDGELNADVGTCHSCPKMSCNDPGMSSEPGALCIDVDCYGDKVQRFQNRRIAELRAAGHQVIEGEEARQYLPHEWAVPRGFTRLSHAVRYDASTGDEIEFDKLVQRLPDPSLAPKQTHIQYAGKLHAFIKDEDFESLLKAIGMSEEDDDEDGDRTPPPWLPPELRLTRDYSRMQQLKVDAIRQLVTRPRTLDELRALVEREIEFDTSFGLIDEVLGVEEAHKLALQYWVDEGRDPDDFSKSDWLREWVSDFTADQLGAILGAIALEHMLDGAGRDESHAGNALGVLAHYGVDVKAALAPYQAASTPTPAARASKGTADDEEGADDAEEHAQGTSQAGSAGKEKGAGVAGDAGLQGEEQGAVA